MTKLKKKDKWLFAFLYLLAFMLLREWLLPVMELTDTDYLGLFLLFIGLSFLLALLGVKWWIVIPAKILFIFWAIHYVFLGSVVMTKSSILLLMDDLFSNLPVIAAFDWMGITNPLRTVMFFVLLWMTTYLIRHWIEVRKSILLFYIMTVVFIAFIDTFSAYSADHAIIRIMVNGLLLIGLLYIMRVSEKHGKPIKTGMYAVISLPLLFMVVGSSLLASAMPERDPVWPDPVPFFKSIVTGSEGVGGVMSTSGYDPDDSKLGGPFNPDDRVVFEAKAPSRQYWKIESKDTYTSKGWVQNMTDRLPVNYFPGSVIADEDESVEEDRNMRAEIAMKEPLPYLVQPYGYTKIDARSDVLLNHYQESGQLWAMKDGEEIDLDQYGFDFNEPIYSMKALREADMAEYGNELGQMDAYLQLPSELPERVKELAASITENEASVYDKAKSIERYFKRNGFVYDQTNVPVPKADEDYVDQFLFESKHGYCDNFSTSMVVMLRSVGIPARWAKGFAPGTSELNGNGERVYTVTNNEAHSWVEAYLPGIGWMPFEPTIGFTNPAGITYDVESNLDDPQTPEMEELPKPEENKPDVPEKSKSSASGTPFFTHVSDWLKANKLLLFAAGGVLLIAAWWLFSKRSKWLPKFLVRRYENTDRDWGMFAKQYKGLLRQLERFGLKRKGGMTLGEFASTVDRHFGGNRMRILTDAYEKGIYGGHADAGDYEELQEIWKDLIIRTSG